MGVLSFSDLLAEANDTKYETNFQNWKNILETVASGTLMSPLVSVDLTTAAQTTLMTVPTGYSAIVHGAEILGVTAQSGSAKASTLKIGTTSGSYNEVLGEVGHEFRVGAAQTLIAAAQRQRMRLDRKIPRLLSRTLVLLTAAAQTTLYTVPTGANAFVNEVVLEGDTAQSGGTSSKLLVGTTGNSYAELLNGTTGHTFTSGTATSLLAVGARVSGTNGLPGQTTMSLANKPSFVAADVIKADVSGTVVTAGKVYVELWGNLDTDGPKVFTAGSVIKADVSGSALCTGGAVKVGLLYSLVAA